MQLSHSIVEHPIRRQTPSHILKVTPCPHGYRAVCHVANKV